MHPLQNAHDGPAEILRRMMGTITPMTVQPQSRKPQRSKLPRGVTRSFLPGILAQAEDGSNVRGRFGHRASGHGVGQRSISGHPLSQLTNTNASYDVREEIDKTRNRDQRVPQNSPVQGRYSFEATLNMSPGHGHSQTCMTAVTNRYLVNSTSGCEQCTVQSPEEQQQQQHNIEPRLTSGTTWPTPTVWVVGGYGDGDQTSSNPEYRTVHEGCFIRRTSENAVTTPTASIVTQSDQGPYQYSSNFAAMVEPLPYSLHRSLSHLSDIPSAPTNETRNCARSNLPNMEQDLEWQERELAIRVVELQRQKARKSSFELC